jgi:hypothetical protein
MGTGPEICFFLNRPFLGVKNIALSQKNGAVFSIDPELSSLRRGPTPILV